MVRHRVAYVHRAKWRLYFLIIQLGLHNGYLQTNPNPTWSREQIHYYTRTVLPRGANAPPALPIRFGTCQIATVQPAYMSHILTGYNQPDNEDIAKNSQPSRGIGRVSNNQRYDRSHVRCYRCQKYGH